MTAGGIGARAGVASAVCALLAGGPACDIGTPVPPPAAAASEPRAAAPAPAPERSAYRSVVIFGDTQSLVGRRAGAYADLGEMVDWVVAHRDRERIDFVLHVGDIINAGIHLPLRPECGGPDGCVAPADGCNDAAGRCRAPRPAGCWERRSGACDECRCWALRETPAEWERFAAVWSRLERAGIPYAIVRGNHDNAGGPGHPLDRDGYVQHFGAEHFARIGPASGHRETCPVCAGPGARRCCAAPDAHLWRFRLGTQDVLVVGPSYMPAPAQREWVAGVLDAHPGVPAIVVTHSFAGRHNEELLREVVLPRAEQVFMRVEGHFIMDRKRVERAGGHDVLAIGFNRQQTDPPLRAALALVRFHPGGDGFEAVEALTISPSGDLPATAATRLPRRPFRLPRDTMRAQ